MNQARKRVTPQCNSAAGLKLPWPNMSAVCSDTRHVRTLRCLSVSEEGGRGGERERRGGKEGGREGGRGREEREGGRGEREAGWEGGGVETERETSRESGGGG